jgi:hypothetical protein
MALWAASERFFAKHLGGRFQQDMTPEVAKRLAEITVDPKTVVLTKKVDAAEVGTPKPTGTLAAGAASYKGTIQRGGQTNALALTRTVKEAGDTWVVSDTVQMPMDASDTTTLDKATLVLRKRSIKRGPFTIELVFDSGKASGTFAMAGSDPKPIAVDLGGELFADGAGADAALALLPLADGYTVSFRNLDLMRQKVALKQLKVVGRENVTVAAGTFDAWKAEITSADGDPGQLTLWIATDSHRVVKTAATGQGDAVVTTELQP